MSVENTPQTISEETRHSGGWRNALTGDVGIILLAALAWLVFLVLLNLITRIQYGFHRDELGFIDNARHLAWGYIEYPPLTPFLTRIGLALFGPSLVGLRLFAALSVCITLGLVGLMTRDFGGGRRAQLIAMLAAGTAPILAVHASFYSYETLDYLWWVLVAFCLVRLIKTENPRWWLGVGAALGLGMLTKYIIAVLVLALIIGVILTPLRRYLKSPWLWAGAGLALLIVLPNLIWQIQHDFPSADFLSSIHERDVRIGRTDDFLVFQFFVCTSAAAILLWTRGLYEVSLGKWGKEYRIIGWMFVVSLVFFIVSKGRFYYLGPAYPMILAAGTARLLANASTNPKRLSIWSRMLLPGILILVGIFNLAVSMPLAPVGSAWFNFSHEINGELAEEVGWPELVQEVSRIRDTLTADEQAKLGILTTNYGEAGAVNLYGPAYGLPTAISGVNSYWLRGYGSPPPETLIVLGMNREWGAQFFGDCQVVGHTPNPLNVENEETTAHPDIYLCQEPLYPWPELWKRMRWFG